MIRRITRSGGFLFLIAMVAAMAPIESKVEAVPVTSKISTDNILIDNTLSDDKVEKVDFKVEVEGASSGSKARAFKATAYCLRGKTASGRHVRRGIVAADRRVLRLGTRIHLTGGRYTGNYVVADTGGKVKGRILDIWVPSCKEARRWGRRTVQVKVLSQPKKKARRKRR